jgi:4'-phosphopantetheinyl transferase
VHVWVEHLDPDSVESPRRLGAVTAAECDRASRFHRQQDAERYLFAHGALRLVLSRYLMCDPRALRFGAGAHGKPFLEDAPLEFNLSHSGTLALIAVARSRRVGVDVEQLRPLADLDSVAARVCTRDELVTLAGLAEPTRTCAFFAMWTRKEALAKVTGEGISGIVRAARDAHVDAHLDVSDQYAVSEVSDLPGYAACVAAEGEGWQLVRCNMTDSAGRR